MYKFVKIYFFYLFRISIELLMAIGTDYICNSLIVLSNFPPELCLVRDELTAAGMDESVPFVLGVCLNYLHLFPVYSQPCR